MKRTETTKIRCLIPAKEVQVVWQLIILDDEPQELWKQLPVVGWGVVTNEEDCDEIALFVYDDSGGDYDVCTLDEANTPNSIERIYFKGEPVLTNEDKVNMIRKCRDNMRIAEAMRAKAAKK